MLLDTLLSKYEEEDVYAMNVTIAMILCDKNIKVKKCLYTLNERVPVQVGVILTMVNNINSSRKYFLKPKFNAGTVLEFLQVSSFVASMLTIDDAYLPYINELGKELDKFIMLGDFDIDDD